MKADAARPMHLLSVFPGFGVGGAQVRFAAIANRLGDSCRHSIVALNGDTACREKLDPHIDVEFPEAGHIPGRMAASVLHARRFLRAAAPDLVLTSNWGAIEWAAGARLARLPHIHTEDGFGPEERNTQIPRRALTRRIVLRGSEVVLPSQRLLSIATGIWKLPPARLHYIPNGIDLTRFTGAEPMALPPGQGKVVGTVAALRPEKNIGRLLRAFARVSVGDARPGPAAPPGRLLIVGDGPERPALQALADALGIAHLVLFAGHTIHSERWLAAMDVFALPSDTEQMPLSLLEAMATGLPAVCTDVGDVRQMLASPNTPFVTEIGDEAFAAGLHAMLQADGREIGIANRIKAIADYDQNAMMAAYAALFNETRTARRAAP